jgi:uncharacterized protein
MIARAFEAGPTEHWMFLDLHAARSSRDTARREAEVPGDFMRLARLLSAIFSPRIGLAAVLLPLAVAGFVLWGLPYLAPEWTSSARRIDWPDLIAKDGQAGPSLRGLVQHGQLTAADLPIDGASVTGAAVVPELNGQEVTISGFMVPLRFDADRVNQFLLVPYAGACIHVPPPPPNQIILVDSEEPVETSGLLEAVTVTGILHVADLRLELADVAYTLDAESTDKYW